MMDGEVIDLTGEVIPKLDGKPRDNIEDRDRSRRDDRDRDRDRGDVESSRRRRSRSREKDRFVKNCYMVACLFHFT